MIALLSSMILSLPGFYLVKNAVERDWETGVGQITATTPLRKGHYTVGKALSNFIFLAVIVAVVGIAAGGMQFIRGEDLRLNVWALLAPFLFTTLPAMALVAAVAVLFETIPLLRGGFGNIVYFAFYITIIIVSLSGAAFDIQGVIEHPINDPFGATVIGASMLQAASAAFPGRQLDFGIGLSLIQGTIQTFRWEGVQWTTVVVLGRLVWVGTALVIALLATIFFSRFDPARSRQKRNRRQRPMARIISAFHSLRFPALHLPHSLTLPTPPLPCFGRVLLAELRLTLKGLRWWWYLVALGLIIAGASNTETDARRALLAAAWIWPVLVWSGIGIREAHHRIGPVVFSAPHPLLRQLPATWLGGVLVAALTGSGVALRLILAGQWDHLLAWGVAALFIPTLALTVGVWSGSSKLFEALYVVLWYLGPVSQVPAFDFMGVSRESVAMGPPLAYLGITATLLALAVLGRSWKIRR